MPLRVAIVIGNIFVIAGAALILVGTLGPWAQVVVFKNIQIALPGFFFISGALCLAIAALVLLGARRSSILCLIGGIFVSMLMIKARHDIPHQIKHQMIGAQMALFPINRLLDQFHISDIEVGGYGEQDRLLGEGLEWAAWGGGLLLLGGAAGLPNDPIVAWIAARISRRKCSNCGARWLTARDANYCPECGAPAPGSPRRCRICQQEALPSDHHCIGCGNQLSD